MIEGLQVQHHSDIEMAAAFVRHRFRLGTRFGPEDDGFPVMSSCHSAYVSLVTTRCFFGRRGHAKATRTRE